MDELLARLRALDADFHPPCTPEALQALEDAARGALDPLLRTLYADHDGMAGGGSLPFRAMSAAEVVETAASFRDMDFEPFDFCAFWTDDNSNYAACYTEGDLRGKVFILIHDDMDLSPCYRSVRSFYDALLDAAEDGRYWEEMPQDYPSSTTTEDEAALARSLVAQYAAATGERRVNLALRAMRLLPAGQDAQLFTFAQDDDMYVQERACEMLGNRSIVGAVPVLAEVVRSGGWNGKMAALRALGRIGDREAADVLIGFVAAAPVGGGTAVSVAAASLRECGHEVRRFKNELQHRAPGSTEWLHLTDVA